MSDKRMYINREKGKSKACLLDWRFGEKKVMPRKCACCFAHHTLYANTFEHSCINVATVARHSIPDAPTPANLATRTSSTLNNHAIAETLNLTLWYTFSHGCSKEPFLCGKKNNDLLHRVTETHFTIWLGHICRWKKWQHPKMVRNKRAMLYKLHFAKKKETRGEVPDFNKFAQCLSTIVFFFVSSWCMWCEVTEWRREQKTTLDVQLVMWRKETCCNHMNKNG